jgi:hypothetical protein
MLLLYSPAIVGGSILNKLFPRLVLPAWRPVSPYYSTTVAVSNIRILHPGLPSQNSQLGTDQQIDIKQGTFVLQDNLFIGKRPLPAFGGSASTSLTSVARFEEVKG